MATIVLDVQDESLLTQIKKACQLLKGVASVKVVSKREKSQACLNSSEREQAQAELKVHKTKNEDITKTAGYKEAMDDVKHGRVYHADSACQGTGPWHANGRCKRIGLFCYPNGI